jgi:hypothetical protein
VSIKTITLNGSQVTVVALPAAPGLRSWEPKASDAVALNRSPFTGETQAQKWLGADLFSAMANLPALTVDQEADWVSFLMQLRGMANAFQMGDPLRPNIKGTGSSPYGPVVDNTVAGGNAAGSETLGTQGWTVNAKGVLLRGDWIQVGYRLHKVLDNVDADSAGKALIAIWPTLREQPTSDGVHGGYLNATGSLGYYSSYSSGNNNVAVRWSDFAFKPNYSLPPDAVIQGIYPVILASANSDIAFSYFSYGNNPAKLFYDSSEGNDFTSPSNPDTTTFSNMEFYDSGSGSGIGTSLAALAGYKIKCLINTSLNDVVSTDSITATAVGFAVYYTSATPQTDPQMDPPFSVPSGQGLAWALPSTVEQSGRLYGNTPPTLIGISDGYAFGAPITYNGGIIMNGAKGLFRLASNDRSWSADMTRLTRSSFPIQEYR